MKARLYKLHSLRSQPAFPIGHSLAPAAFLGQSRQRGLASLFFPNQDWNHDRLIALPS